MNKFQHNSTQHVLLNITCYHHSKTHHFYLDIFNILSFKKVNIFSFIHIMHELLRLGT